MAFTHTKEKTVFGNKRIVTGVYTNDGGSTGGNIVTGLSQVEAVFLQPKGSSILANQPVVNEALPLNGGDVTIVTTADEIGSFIAIGR
ncbi:MAG: hypothetical protein MOGMAGMI_02303 [Candidatus Omnitrophica bacterium]|nr:hypothetical protein [Candidatus Omnitrophota bacterium]